jgi:hypothetical protein
VAEELRATAAEQAAPRPVGTLAAGGDQRPAISQ